MGHGLSHRTNKTVDHPEAGDAARRRKRWVEQTAERSAHLDRAREPMTGWQVRIQDRAERGVGTGLSEWETWVDATPDLGGTSCPIDQRAAVANCHRYLKDHRLRVGAQPVEVIGKVV